MCTAWIHVNPNETKICKQDQMEKQRYNKTKLNEWHQMNTAANKINLSDNAWMEGSHHERLPQDSFLTIPLCIWGTSYSCISCLSCACEACGKIAYHVQAYGVIGHHTSLGVMCWWLLIIQVWDDVNGHGLHIVDITWDMHLYRNMNDLNMIGIRIT